MAQEVEIKLAGDPRVLAELRKKTRLAGHALSRPIARTINTTYFDSDDLSLARHKIAFRIRNHGRVFEQTAKIDSGEGVAAARRSEISAVLGKPEPDASRVADAGVRKRVEKLLDRGALKARCKTFVKRTTRQLKTKSGDRIELAFDTGTLVALDRGRSRQTPIAELELELKSGDPKNLSLLARKMAEEFPIRLSLRSKAERGFDLLRGNAAKPRKAGPVLLAHNASVAGGIPAVLQHCLVHLVANEDAVVHARDPEGVHQMRVALRRLRSALSAFGKTVTTKEMAHLRNEAKWAAEILGRARDLDVFMEGALNPVLSAEPKDPRLDQVKHFAKVERARAWSEVLGALSSARYRLFVIDLARAIENRLWRNVKSMRRNKITLASKLKPLAVRALEKRFERVAHYGGHLSGLGDTERHHLRIELKKLRYAAEFFTGLFPRKAVRAYIKRIAGLQEIFGALNDATVARGVAARILSAARDSGENLDWAAGVIIGWRDAKRTDALISAKSRWKALAKTRPFWR